MIFNADVTPGRLNVDLVAETVHDGRIGEPVEVHFSADGRLVATSHSRAVQIFDAQTGEKLHDFKIDGWQGTPNSYAGSVPFNLDGMLLATGEREDILVGQCRYLSGVYLANIFFQVWNIASRTIRTRLAGHGGYKHGIYFARDGRTLASSGYHGVWLWNIDTGTAISMSDMSIADICDVGHVAISLDATYVAAASDSWGVRVWVASTKSWHRCPLETCVTHLTFSPDGGRLVGAGNDGTVSVWDIARLTAGEPFVLHTLRGHEV